MSVRADGPLGRVVQQAESPERQSAGGLMARCRLGRWVWAAHVTREHAAAQNGSLCPTVAGLLSCERQAMECCEMMVAHPVKVFVRLTAMVVTCTVAVGILDPPGVPRTTTCRPFHATVGDIEDNMRLPGPTALASP